MAASDIFAHGPLLVDLVEILVEAMDVSCKHLHVVTEQLRAQASARFSSARIQAGALSDLVNEERHALLYRSFHATSLAALSFTYKESS